MIIRNPFDYLNSNTDTDGKPCVKKKSFSAGTTPIKAAFRTGI